MRFTTIQTVYLLAVATTIASSPLCVKAEAIRATASTTSTTTTTEKRQLRGSSVIHTRTVYHHHDDNNNNNNNNSHDQTQQKTQQQVQQAESLVDPHPHKIIKLRGAGRHGEAKEIELDLTAVQERLQQRLAEEHLDYPNFQHLHTHNSHTRGHRVDATADAATNAAPAPAAADTEQQTPHHHTRHRRHQEKKEQRQQQQPNSEEHTRARHHHHHRHHQKKEEQPLHFEEYHEMEQPHQQEPSPNAEPSRQHEHHHHSRIVLPTGLDEHYNHSLFEELHRAPFEIYETAFGHTLESNDSFPVFIVPEWRNTTGIFSGFSRTATPLVFENMQFLLTWEDVVGASTGVDDDLLHFMQDNNFHATLLIGKAFGPDGNTITFLGLLVSYFQSTQKNILVPFAKLDNFFDDTSEQHLMSDEVKHLELDALHEMLEEQRNSTNSNVFYHPVKYLTDERKQRLQQLEALHFRRLFQLLIRRSFLFSFGYADCLKSEPHALRECLDDTFSIVVKMETNVRGAMDDQIVEELAEINDTFHSKVSEACISASGMGMSGTGTCANFGDLGAYVATASTFL